MFFGKLLAGILGFFVAGPLGLIFGLVLGHLFDRGLAGALGMGSADLEKVKEHFFRSTFLLMGHVAKSDGRISEDEVTHTEGIFRQLGLSDDQRHDAILLFKEGGDDGFSVEDTVQSFLLAGGAHPALKQTMMLFLVTLALADRQLHSGEKAALLQIGSLLGYSAQAVEEFLRMATAQEQFHQQPGHPDAPTLSDAYAALGVGEEAPDKEVKRAYRKLMSQYHPDKLSARGVPEDMLKLATEKAQEIQAAYELIRKSRGTGKRG
ncbi:MAG: DnaJ like chaperone protein [Glaciecola sp.]|jgi:DnaJ like chaperone protein|uniref:co-chaperone DjlA n=1 Tax=Congregibacter sp. TaxID=2744308 RepID=UPI0039E2C5E8